MTDSLYKGKRKFTREQVVFIVETVLIGILDRIESGLPDMISWEDRCHVSPYVAPYDLTSYDRGALEAGGMALGVLCAELTCEGASIGDALACANDFQGACERLVREAWADKGKAIRKRFKLKDSWTTRDLYGSLYPDTRKSAEAFVDRLFEDVELSTD